MSEIRDHMRDFSCFLMQGRYKNNLKIRDMAEKLGLRNGSTSHWETGNVLPARERLADIARVYMVDEVKLIHLYELALGQRNRFCLKRLKSVGRPNTHTVFDLFSGGVAPSTKKALHRL